VATRGPGATKPECLHIVVSSVGGESLLRVGEGLVTTWQSRDQGAHERKPTGACVTSSPDGRRSRSLCHHLRLIVTSIRRARAVRDGKKSGWRASAKPTEKRGCRLWQGSGHSRLYRGIEFRPGARARVKPWMRALRGVGRGWSPFAGLRPPRRHRGNLRGHQHQSGDRNGGLTAAVSRDGDLTVVSWPSPSYTDQLHYLSGERPNARSLARMGADESHGSFAGLVIEAGSLREVTFFSRCALDAQGHLLADDTSVIVHPIRRGALGSRGHADRLRTQGRDVLVRRFSLETGRERPVSRCLLLSYATSRLAFAVPQVPARRHPLRFSAMTLFAAWDRQRGAAIHFHPAIPGSIQTLADASPDPSRATLARWGPDELPRSTRRRSTPSSGARLEVRAGVYATLAGQSRADQLQIRRGLDR